MRVLTSPACGRGRPTGRVRAYFFPGFFGLAAGRGAGGVRGSPVCCVLKGVVLAAGVRARSALAFMRVARADRLVGRHQLLLAVADQVGAPHPPQRLAQQRPVVRIVIAQERLVQPARASALRDVHAPPTCARPASAGSCRCGTSRSRVAIGDGRNACTWSGAEAVALEPQREVRACPRRVVPGCAAMKYGIRYCSLPASFE